MPAHKPKDQVGESLLSNSKRLTELDRGGNGQADGMAKEAVEIHRVGAEVIKLWQQTFEETKTLAKRIARATHKANNQEKFPFQDSEAARWKSDAAAAERRKAKHLRSKRLFFIDQLKVVN